MGGLFYCETIKRELNKRLIYECRCNERLKVKGEGSTCLEYTGLCQGLEHLKIEIRSVTDLGRGFVWKNKFKIYESIK
jgi:hypothetical protein